MSLSLEIGIRFIRPPEGPWVLQHMRCWHCGDGYATGPTELWDEAGKLVKQLRDGGVKSKFVSGDGVADLGFIKAGGPASKDAIISRTRP